MAQRLYMAWSSHSHGSFSLTKRQKSHCCIWNQALLLFRKQGSFLSLIRDGPGACRSLHGGLLINCPHCQTEQESAGPNSICKRPLLRVLSLSYASPPDRTVELSNQSKLYRQESRDLGIRDWTGTWLRSLTTSKAHCAMTSCTSLSSLTEVPRCCCHQLHERDQRK